MTATEAKIDLTVANPDVVAKYKTAGDISARVLEQVKALCVEGTKIYDICVKGDELLVAETNKIFKGKNISKGIAFPTAISPNNICAHLSPLPTDEEASIELKSGDVLKISLGAQIDGYASILADTIVVSSVVSPRVADAISAAWYASEAAIRTVKPGNKNWDVTNIVDKIAAAYECKPAEGMLSTQQTRNNLDEGKQIILNPSEDQKKGHETFTFEEGEVYGVDILISTSDGKVKPGNTRTSIYKKTDKTYQLKLKTSRLIFSEVQKKAGAFPFVITSLDDPKKARMGLQECQSHSLVIPYAVVEEKEGEVITQFFTTVALTKNGTVKLAGPIAPNFDVIKSDKKITDQQILDVLAQPLKTKKAKKTTA
ncbi:proliferation-associated protein 1 [Nadsonia fulvescens var. elongata DSM 6958]|uniref:Proliferation-associated protein 1 n=1 Tax=Nadsonia fulvescens var. elongata DSM 6958 TaxID=857566 RepID=A0A1E3PLW8_9ASCO|nr:proliferation-associated protein 1 [Nadsonia fulvescens var. elongata DSM 6958]